MTGPSRLKALFEMAIGLACERTEPPLGTRRINLVNTASAFSDDTEYNTTYKPGPSRRGR